MINGKMSGGKGFTIRDVLPWGRLDGNGLGWQREWVVMGVLLALDMGKPMVIHCKGVLNFIGNV